MDEKKHLRHVKVPAKQYIYTHYVSKNL